MDAQQQAMIVATYELSKNDCQAVDDFLEWGYTTDENTLRKGNNCFEGKTQLCNQRYTPLGNDSYFRLSVKGTIQPKPAPEGFETKHWLDCELMNTIIHITVDDARARGKKCIAFPTQAWKWYMDYKDVLEKNSPETQRAVRILMRIVAFSDFASDADFWDECDMIAVPMNIGGIHWVAGFMNPKEKSAYVLDSMGDEFICATGGGNNVCQTKAFLKFTRLLYKLFRPDDKAEWVAGNPPLHPNATIDCVTREQRCKRAAALTAPCQDNGNDCGVFTCLAIEFILHGWPLLYDRRFCESYRRRYALTLIHCSTLY